MSIDKNRFALFIKGLRKRVNLIGFLVEDIQCLGRKFCFMLKGTLSYYRLLIFFQFLLFLVILFLFFYFLMLEH